MKKLMTLVLSALVAVSCFGEGNDPDPGVDFRTTYMVSRTSRVPPEPGRVPAQLVDFKLDRLQDADGAGTDTNTYHYGSFVTDFDRDYYPPESRNFRTLQHFINWLDWRLSFYPPIDDATIRNRWKWLYQPYPSDYELSSLGIFDWIDDNGPYVQGTNILAGYNDATWTIHSEDPNHFWQWGPYLYGTSISGSSNGVSTKITFTNMTYGPFLLGMGVMGASNGVTTVATLNDGQFYGPFLLGTAILGASNGTTSVTTCSNGVYGPFLVGIGILGGTSTGTVVNTYTTNGYGPFLMGTNILGGEFTNGQWEVAAGLYPDTVTELVFNTSGDSTPTTDFSNNKAFRYVFRGALWYETEDLGAEHAFSYDLVIKNTSVLTNSSVNPPQDLGSNNGVLGPGAQGWLWQPVVFRGLRHYAGSYNRPEGLGADQISIPRAAFNIIASSYATLCLKRSGVYGVYTVMEADFVGSDVTLTLDRNLEDALKAGGGRYFLCGDIGQFGLPAGSDVFHIITSKTGLSMNNFKGFVRATSRKRNPWLPD